MKTKAYEVIISVWNGYNNETRTIFVESETKKAFKRAADVLRVHLRKDINPEECEYFIEKGFGFDFLRKKDKFVNE